MKLLVYRKPSHTDQYLSFHSHHPLHQKLGMIRTLMDRCHNIVTEEGDREIEEKHITEALERCGYPKWTFEKVKRQRGRSKEQKEKNRKDKKDKSNGLVVIPYVQGVSEPIEHIFKKYDISTAMRPYLNIHHVSYFSIKTCLFNRAHQ